MLVASRDPFHAGTNHPSTPPGGAPKLARAMSALQIVGTLLAIPVGLGSAYSMYRANFSAEASCQSLRANIIMILDKGENASARHMLVRRDVETFERSCGAVDPDATAAFKLLLAADKSPAVAAARRVETQPKPAELKAAETKPAESKPVERKAEPRAESAAKQPAPAVVAPVQQDAAASDGQWLEAVRSALVAHTPEAAPVAEPKAAEVKAQESKAEPKAEPKVVKAAPARPRDPQTPDTDSARPVPSAAPTLPPPTAVANVPQPAADDGHPVPPGAIPDAVPKNEERSESMLGALISHIPIVGPALVR